MKTTAILTALLAILMAGCTLRGKPAKSAVPPAAPKPAITPTPAPPPPLSIPQTRVQLPKAQPVDRAALDTEEVSPPEPPPAATSPARARRGSPAVSPAAGPPAAATAPPEPRETVQEVVPLAEVKRLQERVQARRREVNQIIDQLARRQLTPAQQNMRDTIRNFLALSEEAVNRSDMRQADALAERAQILAQELQSEK